MVTEIDPNAPETTPRQGSNVVPLSAAPTEPRPTERVLAFARKHPVLMVTGAVAAGLAVSALLPRKSARKMLGKAVDLAEVTGAAAMMFGRGAGGKAQDLGRGARKRAAVLGHKAEDAGHVTAQKLERYGLAAIAAASALGRATAARAEKLGDAAAERSHKVKAKASELRERITH